MTKAAPRERNYVPLDHDGYNAKDQKALAQMHCFTVEGDENIYLEHKGLVVPEQIVVRSHLSTALLVCGDRNWTDQEFIDKTLDALLPVDCVIHGMCRGADNMAQSWADRNNIIVYGYPFAKGMGNYGGPYRNKQMLERLQSIEAEGCPIKVVAFHKSLDTSKGTKDMVSIAKAAGVTCEVYP